jgi:hypothetical protein
LLLVPRSTLVRLLVVLVLRSTVVRLLVVLVLGRATVPRLSVVLRLVVLRFTCGVAELLWLTLGLELLWLTVGAVELLLRETAADWLLLVLPPCERLRPWAEASDAPMIRHPMSAKLIIIFVTEVFIIVLF